MAVWNPKIECAKRSEIEAIQLERLKWSVQHAYDHVPMYHDKMVKAGVKFDEIILGNITSMDIVKSYNRNINCGQDDVDALTELQSLGVPMVIQLTPQNNPEKFTA